MSSRKMNKVGLLLVCAVLAVPVMLLAFEGAASQSSCNIESQGAPPEGGGPPVPLPPAPDDAPAPPPLPAAASQDPSSYQQACTHLSLPTRQGTQTCTVSVAACVTGGGQSRSLEVLLQNERCIEAPGRVPVPRCVAAMRQVQKDFLGRWLQVGEQAGGELSQEQYAAMSPGGAGRLLGAVAVLLPVPAGRRPAAAAVPAAATVSGAVKRLHCVRDEQYQLGFCSFRLHAEKLTSTLFSGSAQHQWPRGVQACWWCSLVCVSGRQERVTSPCACGAVPCSGRAVGQLRAAPAASAALHGGRSPAAAAGLHGLLPPAASGLPRPCHGPAAGIPAVHLHPTCGLQRRFLSPCGA